MITCKHLFLHRNKPNESKDMIKRNAKRNKKMAALADQRRQIFPSPERRCDGGGGRAAEEACTKLMVEEIRRSRKKKKKQKQKTE